MSQRLASGDPSATDFASSGVRNVAGAKLPASAEPAPFTMPVERSGSRVEPEVRLGVELFAGLPLSTFPGGVAASAFVNVPFSMMLKPAHSWSAVTMTSVCLSFFAKSSATFTASSNALISSNVWAASLAWERLSINAPSTCR